MAVDLSRAVGWWEEWQLRILVLGSLSLQFALFVGSMVRTLRIPMSRLCIWLAYLGADALAIYALATLFNRHKLPVSTGSGSSVLEVLWAPVLLIHLGGQHSITAFSIEDNELWRRHIVTVVSQVTVALYVFCKSWPRGGDKRLLQAAILLFVVGILKVIRKPLTLKSASLEGVMTSSVVYPERRQANKVSLRYVCEVLCLPLQTTTISADDAATMKREEEHDLSLEEYVQEARELKQATQVDDKRRGGFSFSRDIEKLFVDISAPYSRRLSQLRSFRLMLHQKKAYADVKDDLYFAFIMIYTNMKLVFGLSGMLLHLLLPFLALASVVLFETTHHKDHHYKESDVKVTAVLFCCTTLLEFLSLCLSPCLVGLCISSNTVAQHNLVSFYARRSRPTHLMKFCALMCCSEYINKHWYIEQAPESACIDITQLAAEHVEDGWRQYIVDAPSYKRFNNFRGQWTLSKHKLNGRQMWWSLQQVPFDWSVLIWHLATELCIHHPRTTPTASVELPAARFSKQISNYMIYLLFIRPEMLMPGTRQGLFTAACYDIELILKDFDEPPPEDARTVAQQILRKLESPLIGDFGIMVPGACKVAEELMELLEDEEKRWKVIQGVWVEMLCCSASSCRGYLHAKSMGEGVEFLTFVWLLLSRMGMETFADKFQRPEPAQSQGEEIASRTHVQEEITNMMA